MNDTSGKVRGLRGLSRDFLLALQSGELSPILERVHRDRTLCLEMRANCINVYYRGGSLLRVQPNGTSYSLSFDSNYFKASPDLVEPPTPTNAATWIAALPALKNAMDLFFARFPKDEREIQQHLVRDNNFGGVARSTDYYVCDIEYQSVHGRFDAVGVHWPSSPHERKQDGDRRLVFFEVKQGDDALDGESGLHAHIMDVNDCLADLTNIAAIKQEMITVFGQKRALGLLDCGKDLRAFNDQRPLLILVLVNHDPGKTRLRELLQTMPPSPHADLRIAVSSLMGYGLYDQGVMSIEDTITRYAGRI